MFGVGVEGSCRLVKEEQEGLAAVLRIHTGTHARAQGPSSGAQTMWNADVSRFL
ncbi:hypothetical protein ABN034_24225 [Actinopolymorpha sp. B11F2]|uniref:hypothetical protein n=1 Tax=Actinopolymorpha sp. B11F2 TaxID=3160862 RepID=UPI0032E4C101